MSTQLHAHQGTHCVVPAVSFLSCEGFTGVLCPSFYWAVFCLLM